MRPWSTQVHNPNGISIGSAVFCTAHVRVSSGIPSPWKLPLSTGDLAGPSSNIWFLGSTRLSIPNRISIGSAVFAQLTADSPYTLQSAAPSPSQNYPFLWGCGPHLIHDSLGPPESVLNPNGISRFCRDSVTDRQTDRQTTLLGLHQ